MGVIGIKGLENEDTTTLRISEMVHVYISDTYILCYLNTGKQFLNMYLFLWGHAGCFGIISVPLFAVCCKSYMYKLCMTLLLLLLSVVS